MSSTTNRLGQTVLGAALTGVAAWITWRNLNLPTWDGWLFWVPIASWLLTMGVLCWWSALSENEVGDRAAVQASWRAGWTIGGLGFAVGFIGPLVVNPGANLGPLLGILITGPFGFVLGALGAGLFRGVRGRI